MANMQLSKKPEKDTMFAQSAAIVLKEIVTKNNWAIKFNNGSSEHLKYEAWQTIGKYYGYTVKTGEAQFVKYGDIEGFEAKAWVLDNKTGIEIGGAEAACMRDEANWKSKPLFQLKSMAQTRAGSKALRQILGFVVALAGYSPTPAEEIDNKPQQVPLSPAETTEEAAMNTWPGATVVDGEACTCHTTGKWHKRDCPLWKEAQV